MLPRLRPGMIERPRLQSILSGGLEMNRKLILISAPAGYGKTTLAIEWAQRCGRRTAWFSLDDQDNDPARFLSYLSAALQDVDDDLTNISFEALLLTRQSIIDETLVNLINQVSTWGKPLLLILDDFHAITNPEVHRAVEFLIDHLPDTVSILITTRSDPPLPLALLRSRGQLMELRQNEMRFTLEESRQFITSMVGQGIHAEDIVRLADRTEGWIAGLQLAAVSLRDKDSQWITAFVKSFSGTNRHILDYLLHEVLLRQSEEIRQFLLHISILDRLSADLCDAVVGRQNSQAMLESLERNNIFVTPLDENRSWYVLHPLLVELLKNDLLKESPGILPELHQRAYQWLSQHNLVEEAIKHVIQTGDFVQAVTELEAAAETMLMHGDANLFQEYARAIPQEILQKHPMLLAYQCIVLIMRGSPLEEVEDLLKLIDASGQSSSTRGAIAGLQAILAAYQGDKKRCLEYSDEALKFLPPDSLFFRSLVVAQAGLDDLYAGEMEEAWEAFSEASRLSREVGNVTVAVISTCQLAEISILRGDYYHARENYLQALALAENKRNRWYPIAGMAMIGLGKVYLESCDLEAAELHLQQGIELATQVGATIATRGYISLAQVFQLRGDLVAMHNALDTAQGIVHRFTALKMEDIYVDALRASLEIEHGDLESAFDCLQASGLEEMVHFDSLEQDLEDAPLTQVRPLVSLAEIWLAQDRSDQALRLLRALLERSQNAGWGGICVEIFNLISQAWYKQGNVAQAMAYFQLALRLAKAGGMMGSILYKGRDVQKLLKEAERLGIEPAYVSKLLDRFDAIHNLGKGISRYANHLAEKLSARENEILSLLSTELPVIAIAQRLNISESTARSHIKHIYNKLGVHSRFQAVQRAKELNL